MAMTRLGLPLLLLPAAFAWIPVTRPLVPRSRTTTVHMSSTAAGVAKTGKRGFPIGDPRSKGGDESDLGLQVGPAMWKWPRNWPYPINFHYILENQTSAVDWYNELPVGKTLGPFMDEGKTKLLLDHLGRHLPATGDVLDLGAGANTYLPENWTPTSLVGVGANERELDANTRLSKRVVLDLNEVSAENRLPFEDKSFDIILCSNAAEFLIEPREMFKELYRVLRPGGMVQVAFTTKGTYGGFEDKTVQFWSTMEDAQKMYVIASYFQFSRGGWERLKGYDLSEIECGPEEEEKFKLPFGNKADEFDPHLYVVSAAKAIKPSLASGADVISIIRSEMWEAEYMDSGDRMLCAERLNALYNNGVDGVIEGAKYVDSIYDILNVMRSRFLEPTLAMIAANLAPFWRNTDIQVAALKEGLGLVAPTEEFWKPLGQQTKSLEIDDKIWLLIDLLALFTGKEEDEALLNTIPGIISDAKDVIREKVPDLMDYDVELLAVDTLFTDYVLVGEEDRATYLDWLKSLAPLDLRTMKDARVNYKVDQFKAAGYVPAER